MTLLSAQSIRESKLVYPFFEKTIFEGCTFGLSSCGYDARIAQDLYLRPGDFVLASTIEYFKMPLDLAAKLYNKSSWIRRGIDAAHSTIIEPNWCGYLTLEVKNKGHDIIKIKAGTGIVQIVFEPLDKPTELPYSGKYQDQLAGPQQAIMEN